MASDSLNKNSGFSDPWVEVGLKWFKGEWQVRK